jgi:predicted MPP superfamily phosphohydrolase
MSPDLLAPKGASSLFTSAFIILVAGLQALHWRLLRQLAGPRARRWILAALFLVHLPLVLYAGLRLTGGVAPRWLRLGSRATGLFQLLTLADLLTLTVGSLAWKGLGRIRGDGGGVPEDPRRRRFLRQTGAAGLALAAFGAARGSMEALEDPGITRLQLTFRDLPPGLDGLRLAHISDLHSGPLVKPGQIERWRQAAEAERPELLLLTGDIVTTLPGEALAAAHAFRDFPAPLGCFAVLGNHDYFSDPGPIRSALEGAGFRCLENRHALVARNSALLALVGLQDPMARRNPAFGPGPRPDLAVQGLPPEAWRICLCHRPDDWGLARETGAPLTLAGHTHGGQVNLVPGVSSAILLGQRFDYGLYREGLHTLFVTRGLGVIIIPVRLGAPPEIALITLRRG